MFSILIHKSRSMSPRTMLVVQVLYITISSFHFLKVFRDSLKFLMYSEAVLSSGSTLQNTLKSVFVHTKGSSMNLKSHFGLFNSAVRLVCLTTKCELKSELTFITRKYCLSFGIIHNQRIMQSCETL